MPRSLPLALMLGVCACAEKASAPAVPPPLEVYDTHLVGKPAPDDEQLEVELIEPGREPRRRLRYRFEAGRSLTVLTEKKDKTSMVLGDKKLMEREMPPSRSELVLRIAEVDEQGRAHCDLTLGETHWIDWSKVLASDSQVQKTLDALRGHVIHAVIDPRGRVVEQDLGVLPKVIPGAGLFIESSLRRLAEMLTTALPEEPIGVGGRWRVSHVSYSQGLFLPIETEFEIQKLDEHRLVAASRFTGNAPPQLIAPRVELRSSDGESHGHIVFDFGSPAPIEQSSASTFTMGVKPRAQGKPSNFTMITHEEISTESR